MLKKLLPLALASLFVATANADEADIKKAMEAQLGAKVESVAKSGYLGLYEIYVDGNILYTDEKMTAFIAGGQLIEGKTMKEHLRFSIVYWHTMRGTGSDPFGPGTAIRPWDDGSNSVDNALTRVEAAFELFQKLDAPYYAFHDRDVARLVSRAVHLHHKSQNKGCKW